MDLYDAQELAKALMREHGLIEEGWVFKWDRAKKRAGACHYKPKQITLSMPLMKLWDEPEVRDTILHEIAHAKAGHRAGHGIEWRMAARSVGAKPERCYHPERDGLETIAGVWVGTCLNCEKVVRQHRAPLRVSSCNECSNHHYGQKIFAFRFAIKWSKNDVVVPLADMTSRYRLEYVRLCEKYRMDPHGLLKGE